MSESPTLHQKNEVTINILGKHYHIKCPTDKIEELKAAAQMIDREAQAIMTKTSSFANTTERNAILLSALNIAHQLILEKRQNQRYLSQVKLTIQNLCKKLEKILTPPSQVS